MQCDTLFRDIDSNFINYNEDAENSFNYFATDITVNQSWKMSIPIEAAGSLVNYSFTTEPGDINFEIVFVPLEGKESEVLKQHRVPSHVEPITGIFKANHVGTAVLIWDNSFSWFTPKNLAYSIEVKQPSVSSMEQTRRLMSKSLMRGVQEDARTSTFELARCNDHRHTLVSEIDTLKAQIEELTRQFDDKMQQLEKVSSHAKEMTARVDLTSRRLNGLCIRMLNRSLLGKVLEFLVPDMSVLLVCKYWTASVQEVLTTKHLSS